MGDGSKIELRGAPAKRVQLVIEFDAELMRVQVTGPLQNRAFALGLLEMARVVVEDLAAGRAGAEAGRIVRPVVMPVSRE